MQTAANWQDVLGRGLGPNSGLDPTIRIISWLLSPEVQIREGIHSGGVMGWSERDSQPQFIYSEITGYYLTFLAYLAAAENADRLVCPRIRSAALWLRQNWNVDAQPSTRAYLDGKNSRDWRNEFHFSFDLAMMLRGVISTKGFLEADIYRSITVSLIFRLSQFVDDTGQLQPCLPIYTAPNAAPWSVRAGPYQLKAAIPILALRRSVPDHLRAAAEEVVYRWRAHVPDAMEFEDLHPLMYFLEGLLLIGFFHNDCSLIQQAESLYRRAFATRGLTDMPAAIVARSDVVAQALRLGCILRQLGYLGSPRWIPFLDALTRILLSFCGQHGAVHFRKDSVGRLQYANTWSSMFAVQAFQLYGSLRQHAPFNPATALFLV